MSGRTAVLPAAAGSVLARDAATWPARRLGPPPPAPPDGLERAIAWLCRTHDATGRQGSSKGYSLLHGWLPAYPETTGYVLGTLLQYAERTGAGPDLRERAVQMADWETRVQLPDGGVMEGHVETRPQRPIVFNTGMVLHGWMDLLDRGDERWAEPAERAARFLERHLGADGTWDPAVEYAGLPHTYDSRVAWAMLRWALHRGDDGVRDAAHRQLRWTARQQQANGWFDNCVFKTGTTPSTHGIAYTLRGLLESHALEAEPRYLDAVVRTSEVLIRKLEVLGELPANYHPDWSPAAGHWCLTGTTQLGGVWLRLSQETGDDRFRNAGLKAVDLAGGRQVRSPLAVVDGALAGSFPVWGRYAPMQFPNWAAKFHADSLMLAQDCRP